MEIYQYSIQRTSMIVTPLQYLDMTDQLAFLQLKASTLEAQNHKLTEQLLTKNELIRNLQQRLQAEVQKQQGWEQQLVKHIEASGQDVVAHVDAVGQEQIKFLEEEIGKIRKDAKVEKIRQLERKMTENRLVNHEMVDFYQKVRSLYMVINRVKTAPSMQEVYKWVSIRKAEELSQMVPSVYNYAGTQKTFNLTNSKTSIIKPKLDEDKKLRQSGKNTVGAQQRKTQAKGKENKNAKPAPKPNGGTKKKTQDVQIVSTESLTEVVNTVARHPSESDDILNVPEDFETAPPKPPMSPIVIENSPRGIEHSIVKICL